MHEWRTHYLSVYHHKQYTINQKRVKKRLNKRQQKEKEIKTKLKKK